MVREALGTKARVEEPPGSGARSMMALAVASGPYCELNQQKGNGLRKTEAFQMEALSDPGDNQEIQSGNGDQY